MELKFLQGAHFNALYIQYLGLNFNSVLFFSFHMRTYCLVFIFPFLSLHTKATTGQALGSYPASYKMNIGTFLGVKRLRRGVDHQPPSGEDIKERVDLYLYFPSAPSWQVPG